MYIYTFTFYSTLSRLGWLGGASGLRSHPYFSSARLSAHGRRGRLRDTIYGIYKDVHFVSYLTEFSSDIPHYTGIQSWQRLPTMNWT